MSQQSAQGSENQSETLTRKETREIVTPYAFHVSPSLFGTPLAGPFRRALAILIDLVLIGFLSGVSGNALAILSAVLLLMVSNRLARQGKPHRWIKILQGIAFVIVVYSVVEFILGTHQPVKLNQQEQSMIQDAAPQSATDNNKRTDSDSEFSLLKISKGLAADLGLGFGWAAFYFTALTALLKGQTLGKKLLGIKVIKLDGSTPNIWESFGRYGGYGAGLATGLLGFLQIFWDPNRQAIQDKISETLVIRVAHSGVAFEPQQGHNSNNG